MTRQFRRLLIYILTAILAVILGLDALLWHVDPFGTRIMVYNWIAMSEVDMAHPTGYRQPPGTYDLGFYTVTVIDDGKRLVPDSGSGDCVIAFVGDSVTWGPGVNDDETFANRLAASFPDVTIHNTARNFYSVSNIAAALDHYPADGYIWTIVNNDAQAFAGPRTYTRSPSAIELYITTLVAEYRANQRRNQVTWGQYEPLMRRIVARRDTLVFGFADDPLARAAGAILMPYPAQVVSGADKHPNAAGHQQIADTMLPYLSEFMTQVCDG